jgi:hypothetical protein
MFMTTAAAYHLTLTAEAERAEGVAVINYATTAGSSFTG